MQRPVFTFTEYSPKSIQADLGWALNDARLDQLERLNDRNGATLFTLGRKVIKASQYVGLVRLGNTTLQVLPKIAYHGDFDKPEGSPEYQNAVRTATHNLLVMLSLACDLPLRALDASQLYEKDGDWLEILTRLFALELHRQFRGGLHHSYRTLEERLPVIRGRWLAGRQIAQHAHDYSRFDVSYDEFSTDTALNRVFALTVETLRRLTQDPYNRRLLLDLGEWLSECAPRGDTLRADLSNVHFTRLTERFRPSFNLAALFWRQRQVQLSAGDCAALAVVFDMNRLFQDFMACFLQRHRKEILPPEWQDGEIVLQAQGQKVYLAEREDLDRQARMPVFRLVPDILITSALGRPVLIADTKYKRLSRQRAEGGVAEGDLYQMLAYAQRWECADILLIYPASHPYTTQFTLWSTGAYKARIRVVELNVQQPLEKPAGLIEDLRLAFMPD